MTEAEAKIREQLVLQLNHSPFERFEILFNDGARFEVVRVFQAGIGLSKGTVLSADGKVSRNFHRKEIRSIEVLAAA